MPESAVEKVHPATPHRRELARREGFVAKSHDLATAIVLLGGSIALVLLGRRAAESMAALARQQLGGDAWVATDAADAVARCHGVVESLAGALLPIFGVIVILAIAGHVGQIGVRFLPGRVIPDLGRIDPLRGIRRLFSARSAMRVVFGVLKIGAIVAVGGWCLWDQREQLLALAARDAAGIAVCVTQMAMEICLKMTAALLMLGLADYAYQRWRHEQDLRMTDEELRQEQRNQQGDPGVNDRRRRLRRALARGQRN